MAYVYQRERLLVGICLSEEKTTSWHMFIRGKDYQMAYVYQRERLQDGKCYQREILSRWHNVYQRERLLDGICYQKKNTCFTSQRITEHEKVFVYP